MSKVIWYETRMSKGVYILTIEGTVTPQIIYRFVSEIYEFDKLLLTSFDMEANFFDKLADLLECAEIDFLTLSIGLLVDSPQINRVFLETGFGHTQDSFILFDRKSWEFRNEPGGTVGIEDRCELLLSDKDILVSYEGIPDLIVASRGRDVIDRVEEFICSL